MSRLAHFFEGYASHLEGRTPSDILQNGIITIGSRSYSHPEFEEYIQQSEAQGKNTAFAREVLEKSKSGLESMRQTPHEKLVAQGLANWRHGPREMFTGTPLRAAALIDAVHKEFEQNARPNDVPLYRGSARHPQTDAQESGQPLSFSENRGAAAAFARQRRKETGTGSVWVAEPGELRGLRMEDYGVTPMFIGKHSEAEWLVHPDRVPFFNDRRRKSR